MKNLNLDYNLHPSFAHNSNVWEVQRSNIDEFNKIYQFCKLYGKSLTKGEQVKISADIKSALTKIFNELHFYPKNDREHSFINELKHNVFRVLYEELIFYFSKNKQFKISNVSSTENYISKFHDVGFFVDNLSDETLKEIKTISDAMLPELRLNAVKGKYTREDLSSIKPASSVKKIVELLNKEFNLRGINDALSLYTGHKQKVGGLCLELSIARKGWWENTYSELNAPPKTEYFHLDEAISIPKAIVYLTDVEVENGPSSVIPDLLDDMLISPIQLLVGRVLNCIGISQLSPLSKIYKRKYHQAFSCKEFRSDFMHLPEYLRFNSHFGWDVLPDSDLEKYMIDSEILITGKAGKFFVFDGGGRVVHRGGLIQSGERVALQVIFSTPPSFYTRLNNKLLRMTKKVLNKN